MKKLYIIGNGFDMHHGLSTNYFSFKNYISLYNQDLFREINKYYCSGNDEDLWANFEENLANLDKDGVLDELSEYLPNTSSDDFRDKDWHTADIESNRLLELLTSKLRKEFSNFIIEASSEKIDPSKLIKIDISELFLSFNYTNTLEKEYFIPDERILYIHGVANDAEDLILGHAIEPDSFIEETTIERPPDDLSPEQLDYWYDEIANQHDPIYENLKNNVNSYFAASYKNTKKIIKDNEGYFEKLNSIKEIYILGHSLSDVDIPYFERIASIVKPDCYWYVSYYSEFEKVKFEVVLENLDVNPAYYQLIKIADLCC